MPPFVIEPIQDNNFWIGSKNFYLSMEKIDKVPERKLGSRIKVDVYTKWGDFIETLNTVKETREKYNIPASKIKNIE